MNYENFVVYGDIMNSLEELPTEEDKEKVALAILRYGTSGEWTDSTLYCRLILPLVKPGIDKAKERYAAAVENGKKGGRPKLDIDLEEVKRLEEKGLTKKDIASKLGISVDTLRRRNSSKDTAKPQNLNNNINTNINTNNNKNMNENESSADFEELSIEGKIEELVKQGYEREKLINDLNRCNKKDWDWILEEMYNA